MSKKPTTFTEPEVTPAVSLPEDRDTACNSEECIWSASRARKVSDTYESRIFKRGLQDIMQYVKAAANSGQYVCTIYNDNISADIDIDSIIKNLVGRGYTVKKFNKPDGWYVKISW